MRRIFVILTLTGLYLVLCSKSCSDQPEQSRADALGAIQAAKDSLASVVPGSSSPNPTILGEEARLLCGDIADYLKIVADTSLAPPFREQATRMVLEGFLSEKIIIRLTKFTVKSSRQDGQTGDKKTATNLDNRPADITVVEFPLTKLLDETGPGFSDLLITKPDTIWIAGPLKPLNDTLFKGILGYSTDLISKTKSPGLHFHYPGSGFMDFYALKTDKIFGHDTLKVWSVRLGENRCK